MKKSLLSVIVLVVIACLLVYYLLSGVDLSAMRNKVVNPYAIFATIQQTAEAINGLGYSFDDVRDQFITDPEINPDGTGTVLFSTFFNTLKVLTVTVTAPMIAIYYFLSGIPHWLIEKEDYGNLIPTWEWKEV